MEAFKLTFMATDNRGTRKAVINKTWAPTGWEAIVKSEKYLCKSGYADIKFIKWKVLSSGMCHFQLTA